MYQNVVVKNGVLWIDGVHMHRFHNASPQQNASLMVDQANVKRGDEVLDICTGLGYTALAAAKRGAIVTTIEQSPTVLELITKHNPEILKYKNLKIIQDDAFQAVAQLPDASFNAIIHDPPRFSMAGELYSQAFYNELFRLLVARGKLFHYTGKPGLKSGKNMIGGIKKRLMSAGFQKITWVESCQGYKAVKL